MVSIFKQYHVGIPQKIVRDHTMIVCTDLLSHFIIYKI